MADYIGLNGLFARPHSAQEIASDRWYELSRHVRSSTKYHGADFKGSMFPMARDSKRGCLS